jgi:hypothetical protein
VTANYFDASTSCAPTHRSYMELCWEIWLYSRVQEYEGRMRGVMCTRVRRRFSDLSPLSSLLSLDAASSRQSLRGLRAYSCPSSRYPRSRSCALPLPATTCQPAADLLVFTCMYVCMYVIPRPHSFRASFTCMQTCRELGLWYIHIYVHIHMHVYPIVVIRMSECSISRVYVYVSVCVMDDRVR